MAFGPRNLGLDEKELQKRVRYGLEQMELDYESYKDRSPLVLAEKEEGYGRDTGHEAEVIIWMSLLQGWILPDAGSCWH